MRKELFEDGLDEIYAAFGKRSPEDRVVDAIFRRVEPLPDAFMAWAVARLQDYAKLPANLGAHLKLDLWPEYLDKNPQLRRASQEEQCPRCNAGPGRIRVFAPDGAARIFCCLCCADRHAIDLLGQPDGPWLAEHGFTWQPAPREGDKPAFMGEGRWRRFVEKLRHAGQLGEAIPEPPLRKRHVDYLQELEEAW